MTHWKTKCSRFELLCGDSIEVMRRMPAESVDLVFADPPYFLSGDGSTCRAGKRAKVRKGAWDEPASLSDMHAWNGRWLAAAKRLLRPHGAIWVSGTIHSIHSVALAMQQLRMHLVNEVVWEKPNPPPNLACRCITHSHETLVWASKSATSKHHFDYVYGKSLTGKQLKDVWRLSAPSKAERVHGDHPTQKPLALVGRCLHLTLPDGGTVLDPFVGSGTTGVAVAGMGPGRAGRFIGIDRDAKFLEIARLRIVAEAPELEDSEVESARTKAPAKRRTP